MSILKPEYKRVPLISSATKMWRLLKMWPQSNRNYTKVHAEKVYKQWKYGENMVAVKYIGLQSWTEYLRKSLVFM